MNENHNLILVAEDDPVLQLVIVKQLSKLGFVAHTVHTGVEAVIMAKKIPYAMVFMDIQMPKQDGLSATAEIRKNESNRRVPIIALTATADKQECIRVGMDDFLSKPITVEQLRDTIKKWLQPAAHPQSSRTS